MQEIETIIELNAYFTEEDKKKFLKLMNEQFDIKKKDIAIYKASDFASEIYDQMFRILGKEN